jgi:hypothetical protein
VPSVLSKRPPVTVAFLLPIAKARQPVVSRLRLAGHQ